MEKREGGSVREMKGERLQERERETKKINIARAETCRAECEAP